MMPSNIHEKRLNIPTNIGAWRLDTCNNLSNRQAIEKAILTVQLPVE
jgi:hypothetical protein